MNVDSYIKEHPCCEGVEWELPFLSAPDASNFAVPHHHIDFNPGVDMQGDVVGLTLHEVDGESAVQIFVQSLPSTFKTCTGGISIRKKNLSALLRALPLKTKVLPGDIGPGIKVL